MGELDSRGVLRGSCTACSCGGYGSGQEGKKCVNCGHPPGKHQNLSTGRSTSSSTSSTSLSPTKLDSGMGTLSLPQCVFPGCNEEAYFDLNTSFQASYCQKHVNVEQSASPTSFFVVDDDHGEIADSDNSQQSLLHPKFHQSHLWHSPVPPAMGIPSHRRPTTPILPYGKSTSEGLTTSDSPDEQECKLCDIKSDTDHLCMPIQQTFLQTSSAYYQGVLEPNLWNMEARSTTTVEEATLNYTNNSKRKAVSSSEGTVSPLTERDPILQLLLT